MQIEIHDARRLCCLFRVSTLENRWREKSFRGTKSHLHAMLFLIKLSPRTEPAIVRAAFIDYQPISLSICSVSWIHPSHFVFLFCICVKQDLICIAIVKNILGHGRVLVCPRFVVAIKSFLVGVSPSKTRDKDRLFCQLSLAPASPTWMFTIENQLKSNGESFQTVTYAPACNLSFRSVRT